MDRETLERELIAAFDADEGTVRVVARQARDLAASGQYEADFDAELTVQTVLDNLADAPDGYTLVERWNWWVGALEVSHGGYTRFDVHRDLGRPS